METTFKYIEKYLGSRFCRINCNNHVLSSGELTYEKESGYWSGRSKVLAFDRESVAVGVPGNGVECFFNDLTEDSIIQSVGSVIGKFIAVDDQIECPWRQYEKTWEQCNATVKKISPLGGPPPTSYDLFVLELELEICDFMRKKAYAFTLTRSNHSFAYLARLKKTHVPTEEEGA